MVYFQQALMASALVALSSAAPQLQKRMAAFTVNMVPKDPSTFKTGPAQYLKSLSKFNGSPVQISVVSNAAAASSVTATSVDNDSEYTCPVTIGDQTFTLDFDTGSSDLWVLGSTLSKAGGSSHTYYQPSSTSSLERGERWSISYGDGSSASGTVYSDTVTIGGTTVTQQAVEDATRASSVFTTDSSEDGLVGLAFDSINTVTPNSVSTFFTNAINQGLPSAVLTANLKHNEAGSYTFGSIPSNLYTGSITYTDVDSSQGFWMFNPTSYSIGSNSSSTYADPSVLTGVADTGTTLILIDDSVVSAYYSQIDSATQSLGSYNFDCDADVPDFILDIAGYQAVVPGSYIKYTANGDGTCYGGIQSNDGLDFAIYGDIFLKSQLVVFDRTQDTPRLGFAAQS